MTINDLVTDLISCSKLVCVIDFGGEAGQLLRPAAEGVGRVYLCT